MNIITWSADPLSDSLVSFKVYKSICGTYTAAPPFSVAGKYLKIQTEFMDFPKVIKISSNVPADIVSQMNKVPGLFCKIESNNTISFRATGSFIKIMPTDGAAALGLPAGDYIPQTNFILVATIPFIHGTSAYQYEDQDGYKNDWYYTTTINTDSDESLPSMYTQHTENYLNTCVLEGLAVKFKGGEPLKGARVFAKLFDGEGEQQHGNFSIAKDLAETFTDDYGRWRLVVPRCVKVYFEIVETKYTAVMHIPDTPAWYFSQFEHDDGWRFGNYGQPSNSGSGVSGL